MQLCDRIRLLRTNNSMTQKELGTRVGVSEISVRNWELGVKNPSMEAIIALAGVLDVTTDYLLGVSHSSQKDESLLTRRELTLVSNYRVLDDYGRKAVDTLCSVEKSRVESQKVEAAAKAAPKTATYAPQKPNRYIPRYTTPSAAGYSVPLDGEDFEMILVDNNVPDSADFAVGIQGDSMYPYINNGDTVYVERDCELSIGDVGIFCVDGCMYCKQYYVDEDKNLILVSANPKRRKSNVFVSANSDTDVRCYGRVILDKIDLPDYIFE